MKFMGVVVCVLALTAGLGFTQDLDINKWPPDTDFTQEVHYWSADDFLYETIPSGAGRDFVDSLLILTGGDQVTDDVVIGGYDGIKATMQYFNVADEFYDFWPDYYYDVWPDFMNVDVLVQYFANAESIRDNLGFRLGTLENRHTVDGYTCESLTDQWEWRVFRVDNSNAWLGNLADSTGGGQYGGVNGGTIRFQNTTGLIFRAVAIGPEGAFGDPDRINRSNTVDFDPNPYAILAEWDIDKGITNGLDLYMDEEGDQEPIISESIGPADDQRKAARPAKGDGSDGIEDNYLNWLILDEHFGPTSQPSFRIKVVAEYYDDPILAGETFGPDVYMTAGGGDPVPYPAENWTVLTGSGQWLEAEWYVPDVKLIGVNIPSDAQAGPRFYFSGPIYISRLRMGAIRSSGIYEGVDPIPDSYPFNPDPYGIYAEMDLDQDLFDHLNMANNGGDQEYIIEEGIGPAGDIRTAVRPALDLGTDPFDRYMNFAILDEVFGPNDQPNAVVKMAVDYFDDPELIGAQFGAEVYKTNAFGTLQIVSVPNDQRITLEGANTWRTAAWQVDNLNFSGVNVSPQGAMRLWFSDNSAIHISRVRIAVIRPVGEFAGVDMLADVPLTPVTGWELY